MEKLGIDPLLIAVQIVNFGLLFFLLRKILYRPILSSIKKRQADLDLIESSKVEIEEQKKRIEDEKRKLYVDFQKRNRELTNKLKQAVEEERKQIIERANRQAKRILAETQKQMDRDMARWRQEFGAKMRRQVLDVFEEVLENEVDGKIRQKVLNLVVKKLSSSGVGELA
jgi:F-type H+-transporting ATPase subunit b